MILTLFEYQKKFNKLFLDQQNVIKNILLDLGINIMVQSNLRQMFVEVLVLFFLASKYIFYMILFSGTENNTK